MMYKVIYKFADLQDHRHVYDVGDTYPREGSKPSKERIEALANGMNKIGRPLIEEEKIMNEPVEVEEPVEEIEAVEPIEEEEKPKPKRGRKKKADSE